MTWIKSAFIFLVVFSIGFYDLSAGPVPAIGFRATGSMNIARLYHAATLLKNGKVLITGGAGGSPSTPLKSAELYDPATGIFTLLPKSMNAARSAHNAVLLQNGKVLILGGQKSDGSYLTSGEVFDPVTNTFSSINSMPNSNAGLNTVLLNDGRVLIIYLGGAPTKASIYDPSANKYTSVGPTKVGRHSSQATLLANGQVLITGGDILGSGNGIPSAELFNPATSTFSLTGSMAAGRYDHSAVLLNNGKVLVAGGIQSFNTTTFVFVMPSSVEIYDPATGRFSSAGSLPGVYADGVDLLTGTLLGSNNVLFFGGQAKGISSNTNALYSNGIFSNTNSDARMNHTITALPNCRALITGGRPSFNAAVLGTAEIYQGNCSAGPRE